jgi:peptidoglycan/LPS O-acetylase OafA/YrhL
MPQLDGLRALAVLAVIYTHYLPEPLWPFGVFWGGAGVKLFFVLSGFLITQLLQDARARVEQGTRSRAQALGAFYARRALRLAPAYYAILGVTAAIGIPPVRETILWHLGYLSNFYLVHHGDWNGAVGHLWSLSVEEQFYLLWSLIVVLVPSRRLVWWIAAAIVCGPLFRLVCLLFSWPKMVSWVMVPGSFDALGLGALLAWTTRQSIPGERRKWIARVAGLCGFTGWVVLERWCREGACAKVGEVLSISARALFFFWVVARASSGFRGLAGRLLESRPLLYLGKISYGIYLIHNFASPPLLAILFARLRITPPVPLSAIAVCTTIGLAALSWRFLERPCNRLKARFL